MFISMATEIIAKQLVMITLQAILKALGGPSFSSSAAGFGGSFDSGIPAIGNTTDFSGAFRANGGPVSGGTPYVVGERGPELFVPSNNGGVMSNNDMRAAMGSRPGGAGGSTVLNMSFQSTTINGVEYVSRDQLEQAMVATRRQAASDGANRGMSMTLDKLQQSPSTRSRLGIGGR
jgi:phage-related minor tail protein